MKWELKTTLLWSGWRRWSSCWRQMQLNKQETVILVIELIAIIPHFIVSYYTSTFLYFSGSSKRACAEYLCRFVIQDVFINILVYTGSINCITKHRECTSVSSDHFNQHSRRRSVSRAKQLNCLKLGTGKRNNARTLTIVPDVDDKVHWGYYATHCKQWCRFMLSIGGYNLQLFFRNFALFSTLGGMKLDHDCFHVSKLSEDQKKGLHRKLNTFCPRI